MKQLLSLALICILLSTSSKASFTNLLDQETARLEADARAAEARLAELKTRFKERQERQLLAQQVAVLQADKATLTQEKAQKESAFEQAHAERRSLLTFIMAERQKEKDKNEAIVAARRRSIERLDSEMAEIRTLLDARPQITDGTIPNDRLSKALTNGLLQITTGSTIP